MGKLLEQLSGTALLVASMLYGSGLRRMEVVRLRVNDIDFDQLQLRIWNGKGFKHRLTTLAPELVPRVQDQIQRVALQLRADLEIGSYAGAWMPEAMARKYSKASRSLGRH